MHLSTLCRTLPLAASLALGAVPGFAQTQCHEIEIITADDASSGAVFGQAIDADSGTLVIGARGANKAYVYDRVGDTWVASATLPPDGVSVGREFGQHVSVCGDTILVSALLDDTNGTEAGMVYAFERQPDLSWALADMISPLDATSSQRFGGALAMEGGVAAIGAYYDSEAGARAGALYVFSRKPDGTWDQEAKVLPDDLGAEDRLGHYKIAIDRGSIFVSAAFHDGTRGAVYVVGRNGSDWKVMQKLQASDNAPGSYFGSWLGMSSNKLAIGANGAGAGGKVYMFEYSCISGMWEEAAVLSAPAGGEFGNCLALDNDVLAVGATSAYGSGAVFKYSRDRVDGTWRLASVMKGSDASGGDEFGYEVVVAGGEVITGGLRGGARTGAAYVFDLEVCQCDADFNHDGQVNTLDFIAYLNTWAADCP